jgi:hypothetical protein
MAVGHGGSLADQSSPLRRVPYRHAIGVVLPVSNQQKVCCHFDSHPSPVFLLGGELTLTKWCDRHGSGREYSVAFLRHFLGELL